jgi:hypothetical protein
MLCSPCRNSTSGTTMLFDTMMASAMVSTITMAVAAETPPTKAMVEEVRLRRHRQGQHIGVGSAPGNICRPTMAMGATKRLISYEVERKQPGRAPHVAAMGVLDHRHVELARQQKTAMAETSVTLSQRPPSGA